MSKYKDFEFIKTIENFNEISDEYSRWTHFHYICYYNYSNSKIIKYCIENGAYLNIQNINGSTQFYFICMGRPTKEVLEYCLDNGADLNIKNFNERTPFNLICKNNKHLIKTCKPYINEYDYIKTLKECKINWKEYV